MYDYLSCEEKKEITIVVDKLVQSFNVFGFRYMSDVKC